MNDSNNVGIVETLKMLNEKYGTGFILPLEDDKPKFVPERLLGVLTDHGYIKSSDNGIVLCEGSGAWFVDELKYYISDDSDETVTFDEYVKLFYNTEDAL